MYVFLGVDIDTLLGVLRIPDRRIVKVRTCILDILKCVSSGKAVHVKAVSSFISQIISMGIVLGNITQLMTRCISMCVAQAQSWNDNILLDEESTSQMRFWLNHLGCINVREICYTPHCNRIVYSDASGTGYGGYCVESSTGVSHGLWSPYEAGQSSTYRELTAVYRVFLSLVHVLRGTRVKWFSDNQAVVKIVEKGSMKSTLQHIALDIYSFMVQNHISLEMEWVPRDKNDRADFISKLVDFDDWGVAECVFQQLNQCWGPFEMDWFASWYNAKVPMFYSRYWNPGSTGIDAFSADWSSINGWFNPPVYLITRVIKHMQICGAYGVLIIPFWKSGRFWPFLCPDGKHFIYGVREYKVLGTDRCCYIPSRSGTGIFGNVDLKFRMLALRMDFRR